MGLNEAEVREIAKEEASKVGMGLVVVFYTLLILMAALTWTDDKRDNQQDQRIKVLEERK